MKTPWHISLLAHTIIGVSIVSCSSEKTGSESQDDEHAVHWGYEADNGPNAWGSMSPAWSTCAEGLGQSPIDITSATKIDLPTVGLDMPSGQEVQVLNQAGVIRELDNGHTIQINANTGEKLTVGDKSYALVQFHFHAPSEHTVDGEYFPMEMHFVHQADDGALAVVGLLMEEGSPNPGIEPLWANLSAGAGTEAAIEVPVEFAEHVFPDVGTGFYHYDGSLTTPPCTEGVKWYLRKTRTQISKEQIAAFTAVYDHNNRPVQALNDRTLYLDENPSVVIR